MGKEDQVEKLTIEIPLWTPELIAFKEELVTQKAVIAEFALRLMADQNERADVHRGYLKQLRGFRLAAADSSRFIDHELKIDRFLIDLANLAGLMDQAGKRWLAPLIQEVNEIAEATRSVRATLYLAKVQEGALGRHTAGAGTSEEDEEESDVDKEIARTIDNLFGIRALEN